MTPVAAFERVMHYMDRAAASGFKVRAFATALETVRATPEDELRQRAEANTLKELPGIGDASARLITESLTTEHPPYLDKIEAETRIEVSPEAQAYLDALKGDCHMHSRWSDGGATIEAMARTAKELGREYMVLTDHSPRLTVAHGLNRERLLQQLADVEVLNEQLAPFRILTGMEVDILEDGLLDLDDDLLEQLDVVVASVHSKLRMEHHAMTARMVRAVASPHVDILGHCTGRLIDKRPQSTFDPDYVFAACAQFHTAVEINSRVERRDPPPELLEVALDHGCWFSIDSDAHATGQQEWLAHGSQIAADGEVPLDRIINTRSADDLISWTRSAA
ncbi:MAG: PHP domain-containing protein [Ilumatobacteraceae bacterium]